MPPNQPSRWLATWGWLALALTSLTALLGWFGGVPRLDMAIHDNAQSVWQQAPPSDILVVAIDEPSLMRMGRWPWKRSIHANLLDKINQGLPRAVLLHVLLTEPDSDPLQDQALANAIERGQNKVVLPMGFVQSPTGETLALKPIAALAAHARLGHADVATDADGVLRHAYLSAQLGNRQWPHLAQALLDISQPLAQRLPQASANKPAEGWWQRSQVVALRFLGGPGTMHTVSYADVLSGAVPSSAFERKIVLIGATAHGLGDTFRTPISANGMPMASVEIVAQMVAMLRENSMLYWLPTWAVGLVSAGLIWVLIALYWTRTPRWGLLTTLLSIALIPLISVVLLPMGLWFAPGTFMVMAALSYPIWSWRRLEVVSQHLSAQLTRLGHPAPVDTPSARWDGHLERQAQAIEAIHCQMEDAYRIVDRLIQQLPCAVILADQSGRIVRANHDFMDMLGKAPSTTALGLHAADVLLSWQPTDAPDWSLLLSRAAQNPDHPVRTEVKNTAGDVYVASLVAMGDRQQAPPSVSGTIICLTDVTASKRAEQQRDELLGFIAHDIRSPQASLLALVELNQMNPQAMPIPELLGHVNTLARSTLALSEELIHVMRSESTPLQLVWLDLRKTIEHACQLAEPQARQKSVALLKQWPADMQAWAWVDESQLQRAIMNLLTNAIRFSPSNGQVRLNLQASDTAGEWRIEIHDQGEGISPDNISKLFRRYSRIDSTDTSQQNKGFGLGLVFVEAVLKRHGGQVQVRSELGKGSVFICTLPQGHAPAPAP